MKKNSIAIKGIIDIALKDLYAFYFNVRIEINICK